MMSKLKIYLLLLSVFAVSLSVFSQGRYVEGALYIKLKQGTAHYKKSPNRNYKIDNILFDKNSSAVKDFGIKEYAQSMHIFDSQYLDNVFLVEFDSIALTDKLIEELQKDSRIELIERVPLQIIPDLKEQDPSKMFYNQTKPSKLKLYNNNIPDDLFFGFVGGIHTSWNLDLVGFNEIYGKYSGNPEIKVAVIDNAVWGDHEDLQLKKENLYDTGLKVSGGASPPKSAQQDNPALYFGWSHGTHCAGVVGAITDNNKGIASLASGVTVMGVKASDATGEYLERTAQGALWAVENGAKVLSLSFSNTDYSAIEEAVYKSCIDKGVIVIAAAGNSGDQTLYYPANYPGVISVASVDANKKKSGFSTYGDWINIAAPGGYWVDEDGNTVEKNKIFSTTYTINETLADIDEFKGTYYDMMEGTSMATPLVASLAALILSSYPDLNAYQMLEILQRSSTKVSKNDLNIAENSGIINAPAAMKLLEDMESKYVNNLKAGDSPSEEKVHLSWVAPDEKNGLTGYRIYKNDDILAEKTENLSYTIPYDDEPDAFYGVQALYSDEDGLILYTRKEVIDPTSYPERWENNLHYYLSDSKQLFLYSDEEIASVSIINSTGNLILNSPYNNSGLNVSYLYKGVYVVSVKFQNKKEQYIKILI